MNISRHRIPLSYFFTGQFQHGLLLAGLVPGALFLANPALDGSSWLGLPDQTWFSSIIILSILHQVVGWFVFRSQLVFSLFTRLFGQRDLMVWGIIFFPLLLLRVLLSIGMGLSDIGTLGSNGRWIQITLGIMLLIPVFYTAWSIKQYFGIARALGGDHFREEYRQMPFVRDGIFKYNSNAMYTFAFLLFWSIALLTGSLAAFAAALFQHAYIWVHMYCTEEPDMHVLYKQDI